MEKKYIKNPKTGRKIIVGGPTFNKLIEDSDYSSEDLPMVDLPSKKSKRKVVPRKKGNPMKGWAKDAPKRGKERESLKRKCGNKCFLKPETNGFPVCPAERVGKNCKIDCRGVIAANIRAKQWKHKDVERISKKLAEEYKCK